MSYFSVDVEADGPIPYRYSMGCFGAVLISDGLRETFYGETAPVSHLWDDESLAVSGVTRTKHNQFASPRDTMIRFEQWLQKTSSGRPVFISDNPTYDWQWINYYFHQYVGRNPFGFSARRIGDLYCGMKMDASLNSEWKRLLRKTRHTHNPVDDAKGNAEAVLAMKAMGLKI